MSHRAVQEVPLDQVVVREQIRDLDAATVAALEQSIRLHGVLQPLLGFQDEAAIILLEGHHRLEACGRLGMSHVPMLIGATALDILDVAVQQAVLNWQRKELTAIEKARALHRLVQVGEWSVAEAATQVGTSRGNATKLLTLLDLPDSVQRHIHSGELPIEVGYALSRLKDPGEIERFAAEIVRDKLTREKALRRLENGKRASAGSKHKRVRQVAFGLSGGREVILKGPGLETVEQVVSCLEEALARGREYREPGANTDAKGPDSS